MDAKLRRRYLVNSLLISFLLTIFLWLVKITEIGFDISLSSFGLQPRNFQGLIGIITMPFLHSGLEHLLSNSIPFLVLMAALIYYYGKLAYKVVSLIWLLSGFWLWLIGQPDSIHIGASGVVYGLAAFHFTSGLIRKNRSLTAFSMLVIFLYGSMIWAIFPDFFPDKNISWEGHLTGMIAGIALAWYVRKEGPQPDKYDWEEEEEEEEEEDNTDDFSSRVRYHYKKDD